MTAFVSAEPMSLLPPPPGTCPICAVAHEPTNPHNQQSLYYQYRFFGVRHRWPTWADAVAHCDPELRAKWEQALRDRGAWSEPEDGQPIADPPAESFHQLVEIEVATANERGPETI